MSKTLKYVLICLVILIILIIISILLIIYCPAGFLLDIEPKSLDNPLPESFSGPLKQNNLLSKAEKLFENRIEGPESIAEYNGTIWTSSRNGYIYRIDEQNNALIAVIRLIDQSCQTWNQSACSQPLGMKFNSKGVLYVVEPFFGIFRIKHLMTQTEPEVELILSYAETETLGKRSKFFDDIAIDEGNDETIGDVLYITDISTKFDLTQFVIAVGASETGRIVRFDVNRKHLEIVLENLFIPNGIELSDDKQFIVFAESLARRVSAHYIRGDRSGQTVQLMSGLPGEPDNIRKTKSNTFWIALATARTQQNPLFMDWVEDKPLIRKLLFRSLDLIGSAVQYIGNLFNIDSVQNFGFSLKTGLTDWIVAKLLAHSHGMAIEMAANGTAIRSLHSPDGTITLLSEVKEVEQQNNTVLYFGSFYNRFLAKLVLK